MLELHQMLEPLQMMEPHRIHMVLVQGPLHNRMGLELELRSRMELVQQACNNRDSSCDFQDGQGYLYGKDRLVFQPLSISCEKRFASGERNCFFDNRIDLLCRRA